MEMPAGVVRPHLLAACHLAAGRSYLPSDTLPASARLLTCFGHCGARWSRCLDPQRRPARVSKLAEREGIGQSGPHHSTFPYAGIISDKSAKPLRARLSLEITILSPYSKAATTRCKSFRSPGSLSGSRPLRSKFVSWVSSYNLTGWIFPLLCMANHHVRENREACLSHSR